MKTVSWIGLVVVLLGLASLVVPIPRTQNHGVSAGGVSVGVQTQQSEVVSPVVSALVILGGVGMMFARKLST